MLAWSAAVALSDAAVFVLMRPATAILPLVYAVRRTGSIRVGITALMVNRVDLVVLCAVLLTA